jgi:hypothetical protein
LLRGEADIFVRSQNQRESNTKKEFVPSDFFKVTVLRFPEEGSLSQGTSKEHSHLKKNLFPGRAIEQ